MKNNWPIWLGVFTICYYLKQGKECGRLNYACSADSRSLRPVWTAKNSRAPISRFVWKFKVIQIRCLIGKTNQRNGQSQVVYTNKICACMSVYPPVCNATSFGTTGSTASRPVPFHLKNKFRKSFHEFTKETDHN